MGALPGFEPIPFFVRRDRALSIRTCFVKFGLENAEIEPSSDRKLGTPIDGFDLYDPNRSDVSDVAPLYFLFFVVWVC